MYKRIFLLVSLVSVAGARNSDAQVVQLPTFHSFSVSTTVSVPDSGAAYLGGVSRSSQSRTSRGVPGLSHLPGPGRLFTNSGIGSERSSSHAYASATIIDHAEMDRMILGEAAARRDGRKVASETDRRAAYLSKFISRPSRDPVPSRVVSKQDDARESAATRLAAARKKNETLMASYVKRAEAAEAAGRLGAARCCYDVLVRRGSEEQQRYATRRLAALEGSLLPEGLASRGK